MATQVYDELRMANIDPLSQQPRVESLRKRSASESSSQSSISVTLPRLMDPKEYEKMLSTIAEQRATIYQYRNRMSQFGVLASLSVGLENSIFSGEKDSEISRLNEALKLAEANFSEQENELKQSLLERGELENRVKMLSDEVEELNVRLSDKEVEQTVTEPQEQSKVTLPDSSDKTLDVDNLQAKEEQDSRVRNVEERLAELEDIVKSGKPESVNPTKPEKMIEDLGGNETEHVHNMQSGGRVLSPLKVMRELIDVHKREASKLRQKYEEPRHVKRQVMEYLEGELFEGFGSEIEISKKSIDLHQSDKSRCHAIILQVLSFYTDHNNGKDIPISYGKDVISFRCLPSKTPRK